MFLCITKLFSLLLLSVQDNVNEVVVGEITVNPLGAVGIVNAVVDPL